MDRVSMDLRLSQQIPNPKRDSRFVDVMCICKSGTYIHFFITQTMEEDSNDHYPTIAQSAPRGDFFS